MVNHRLVDAAGRSLGAGEFNFILCKKNNKKRDTNQKISIKTSDCNYWSNKDLQKPNICKIYREPDCLKLEETLNHACFWGLKFLKLKGSNWSFEQKFMKFLKKIQKSSEFWNFSRPESLRFISVHSACRVYWRVFFSLQTQVYWVMAILLKQSLFCFTTSKPNLKHQFSFSLQTQAQRSRE